MEAHVRWVCHPVIVSGRRAQISVRTWPCTQHVLTFQFQFNWKPERQHSSQSHMQPPVCPAALLAASADSRTGRPPLIRHFAWTWPAFCLDHAVHRKGIQGVGVCGGGLPTPYGGSSAPDELRATPAVDCQRQAGSAPAPGGAPQAGTRQGSCRSCQGSERGTCRREPWPPRCACPPGALPGTRLQPSMPITPAQPHDRRCGAAIQAHPRSAATRPSLHRCHTATPAPPSLAVTAAPRPAP